MKKIKFILLGTILTIMASTVVGQSRIGGTTVYFDTPIFMKASSYLKITVIWQMTNGYIETASMSHVPTSTGTELYFANTSPFYDVSQTIVLFELYNLGQLKSFSQKTILGYPAVVVYDNSWRWTVVP